MNRHQSNPFLAGWEENETQAGVFDVGVTTIHGDENSQNNPDCPSAAAATTTATTTATADVATARRHSSSQADVTGNPFGHQQRSADRRLYHRNMSSFEAASLQLEQQQQQQQMQENGTNELDSGVPTDLIAKMTADFQSAIETNDKQFATDVLDDDGNPIELNPFDPFETIVDDDISLPSPAALSSSQDKFSGEAGNVRNGGEIGSNGSADPSNPDDRTQPKPRPNTHDSIDDDDEELVSTPVRNIKSSPHKSGTQSSPGGGGGGGKLERRLTTEEGDVSNQNEMMSHDSAPRECAEGQGAPPSGSSPNESDSIAKASLFASLLASAESGGQQGGGGGGGDNINHSSECMTDGSGANDLDHESSAVVSPISNVENVTHVITGSHSVGPGSVERPVSFFDPFETVIDKDALTSLMNDQQQQRSTAARGANNSNNNEDDDDGRGYDDESADTGSFAPPTKAPQPTPIHGPRSAQGRREPHNDQVGDKNGAYLHDDPAPATGSSSSSRTPGLIAESASIETVIENSSSHHQANDEDSSSTAAGPTPTTTTTTTTSSSQPSSSSRREDTAIPRPSRGADGKKLTHPQMPQMLPSSKLTPAKKSTHKQATKKPSFQEDSSDSSEEDDRIQIVIKARDVSQSEAQPGPTIVPLLPPPPSKSSMKQARERGQVEDMPSPVMSYKSRGAGERRGSGGDGGGGFAQSGTMAKERGAADSFDDDDNNNEDGGPSSARKADSGRDQRAKNGGPATERSQPKAGDGDVDGDGSGGAGGADANDDDDDDDGYGAGGQFVIPMTHSDEEGDTYGKPDTPLYDEDTSYVLDEFPAKYEGPGWEMMLRYPPKKKLTSNRFWKKIFVKLAQVPLAPDKSTSNSNKQQHAPTETTTTTTNTNEPPAAQTCIALQIFDKPDDKKPMQEIPIQATYTVSEISSQQFDQFGKIFTIKLQYIFYKERVGVRQGQLARFIHSGHIGSSTTSGGHGVDPISIGAIKRMGAPIEHSPQISQIIKLGCTSYSDIKVFKNCLEDYLFKMPIHRDRALSTYKTEEVQMAVRDETYLELNQVGTIIKQLARVRLFFLSFLNGMPIVEVGINDIHRQGREVVGRMDILPVVTEEWIRLEACELHSTVEREPFENPESQIIKLVPPDATFFELMRFRIRPPRNRELPLQISANMSVTRTKVSINCEVMVPGCVSRKHGQIPCENIAIKVFIPECWIYFFREEKHFRMGSKKSVNRRPGKVKGIERFLGGGGLQDINDESSLIEVTSGQAKYEHHHHAIVWRAARWPKESQSAYVQNTMKIRLPLTAYDQMPDSFYEFVHVEYTMPATTVSHTTLRSISVNPCDEEPPEKYVKYSAKYEYKVKMRQSINFATATAATRPNADQTDMPEASPIVIMKQPDLRGDLQKEEDSDDGSDLDDGTASDAAAAAAAAEGSQQ